MKRQVVLAVEPGAALPLSSSFGGSLPAPADRLGAAILFAGSWTLSALEGAARIVRMAGFSAVLSGLAALLGVSLSLWSGGRFTNLSMSCRACWVQLAGSALSTCPSKYRR